MMNEAIIESIPTYTVTVTGYGSVGDGIARLDDGKVVFIRNAARGDILEIRLQKDKPRSARAEIVRMLTPSPYRIKPDCPFYTKCGGCDFRHITYEEELEVKLRRLNDALERIGGLTVSVSEILRTGQTDGYRNKAVFHTDGHALGFYQSQSQKIVPISSCMLLKDDINNAIHNLDPGYEAVIRSGRNGIKPPIEEELDGLIFRISGFFQVNTGAALLLYKKAREYAALSKNDTLIDLYCGVGSLTLFAGRDAGYALGIDNNPDAIETAQFNALQNGISHVEFVCADAAKWASDLTCPDCIIVDPPRKGLSHGAITKLLELSPKRIVYISCDPATLARDLRKLEGYTLKEICAVDMFPRTANIECCCLLMQDTGTARHGDGSLVFACCEDKRTVPVSCYTLGIAENPRSRSSSVGT